MREAGRRGVRRKWRGEESLASGDEGLDLYLLGGGRGGDW